MIFKKITSLFTLDIRALSIMRILLGVICLVDLVFFSYSLINSIIPLEVVIKDFFTQNYRSIYTISDNMIVYGVLIAVHTALTISYTLGYKTKYTAPLFWFFTCSIQWANPLFTNAGSDVARLLIWWSIFLPINKIYSIDSGWKKAKTQEYRVSNIATLGIGVQILSIYFFAFFLKTGVEWRNEFSAVYYSLHRSYISSEVGTWLSQYFTLTQGLTIFTLALELLGPILYLIFKPRGKIIIALLFILLHVGFLITMRLWSFPFYCLAGCIILLPTHFRNYIQKKSTSLHKTNLSERFWFTQTFVNIALVAIILYSMMRNIRGIDYAQREKFFPNEINKYGYFLRLDQNRWIFAPDISHYNGWHQINGLYKNKNEIVNLSSLDQKVYEWKPTLRQIHSILPTEAWVKFVEYYVTFNDPKGKYSNYFVQYLCHQWNNNHESQEAIKAIQMMYHYESITLPKENLSKEPSTIQEKYLGTRNCKN
jgi:hypothetical protein